MQFCAAQVRHGWQTLMHIMRSGSGVCVMSEPIAPQSVSIRQSAMHSASGVSHATRSTPRNEPASAHACMNWHLTSTWLHASSHTLAKPPAPEVLAAVDAGLDIVELSPPAPPEPVVVVLAVVGVS